MIRKKLIALIGAFGLAASALLMPIAGSVPVASAAGGFCSPNGTYPNGTTGQLYIEKYASQAPTPGTFFDDVRGDVTVQPLTICIGISSGSCSTQGGSAVLPANLQDDSTHRIFQVGYEQIAGQTSQQFVYTDGSSTPCALPWPDTSFTPINGHRYRFRIFETLYHSVYVAAYSIEDLGTGAISYHTLTDTNGHYTSGFSHAWWGYERWDQLSAFGVQCGQSQNDMAYMGYSTGGNGTIWYRSGLTSSDIHHGSSPYWTSYDHWYLGTWAYTSDMLSACTN